MRRTTDPQAGEDTALPNAEPAPPGMVGQDAAEQTVPELEAQAAERGIHLDEGTGKDGGVVKADLIDALHSHPAPPAGRPPLVSVAEAAGATPSLTTEEI